MKKLLLILGVIVVFLFTAAIYAADIPGWETLDISRITRADAASVILDQNGNEAALLTGAQAHVMKESSEIPAHVKHAFVAAEDARFYTHSGVDITRIIGAAIADIKSMSLREGASTITQQLIKLTHLTNDKKFSRKANEAYLALKLETRMSKDEILCAYLNTVYFGEGAYGIESAARTYFQKSTEALTLSDAAMLAGIIKAPSAYNPFINPQKALERREYVLGCMVEQGYASAEEAQSANQAPAPARAAAQNGAASGWYRDWVLEEASEILSARADDILTGGYTIYTGLDAEMQASIEELFQNGASFPNPAKDGTPAQAAFTAVDAQTGAIRALMGGREYGVARGLNRATQSRRQPGSAFKPISVYAAAVDALGLSPTSILDDTRRTFDGGYTPSNAGGKYYGLVTLRTALSKSLNAASVSLIEFTGIQTARAYAQRAGIPLADADNGLSMALGSLTYGVTPMELACAYAPLANGGMRASGHAIEKITDRDGRVVYEYAMPVSRVMKAESAYLITSMLSTAVQTGSAKALSDANVPIAGKTGTVSLPSGGNRDIWTVAYTPTLIACAWMGFDETDETRQIESWAGGSSYPARLLAAFFQENATANAFPAPQGVSRVRLDRYALEEENRALLAPEDAPDSMTVTEVFLRSNAPQYYSDAFAAPEPVSELRAELTPDARARIWFVIQSANAEYMLIRHTDQGREVCAVASGKKGQVYEYIEAFEGESAAYSVVARNKRMYASGISKLSGESQTVVVEKDMSLRRQIEELFAWR